MKDFKLTIPAKAGTEGKLFGSIGTSDIAEACYARRASRCERSEVRLPDGPLRTLGEHPVDAAPARRRRRAAARCRSSRKSSRPAEVCRRWPVPPKRVAIRGSVAAAGRADAAALDRGRAGRARRPAARCQRLGSTSPTSIDEEDFYRPDHKLIFEAIGALAGDAKPCDAVTVSEQLERTGEARAGGRPGLPQLHWRATRLPPPTSAPTRTSCASARCCGS